MLVLLLTYHQPLLNTYYPLSFVHISYAHDTPADLARGMTNVMPSNGLSAPRQYHTVLTREDFFLEAFLTVCLEVAYHLSKTRIRLLLSFLLCSPLLILSRPAYPTPTRALEMSVPLLSAYLSIYPSTGCNVCLIQRITKVRTSRNAEVGILGKVEHYLST